MASALTVIISLVLCGLNAGSDGDSPGVRQAMQGKNSTEGAGVNGSVMTRTSLSSDFVQLFQHADYDPSGWQVSVSCGEYSLTDLEVMGFVDDDLSSVVVPPGYAVVLYENDNFEGNSVYLGEVREQLAQRTEEESGVWTRMANFQAYGEWNDMVSSLKVKCAPYRQEMSKAVAPASVNISVSALPVARGGAVSYTDLVELYQHAEFGRGGFDQGGWEVELGCGTYTLPALETLGFKNDDLSSVRVPPGYAVTLFEDDDFGGETVYFGEPPEQLEQQSTASGAWTDVTNLATFTMGVDKWNDQASSVKVACSPYRLSMQPKHVVSAQDEVLLP